MGVRDIIIGVKCRVPGLRLSDLPNRFLSSSDEVKPLIVSRCNGRGLIRKIEVNILWYINTDLTKIKLLNQRHSYLISDHFSVCVNFTLRCLGKR